MILKNGLRMILIAGFQYIPSSPATANNFTAEDGTTTSADYFRLYTNTDGFFGWQMWRYAYSGGLTYINRSGTYSGVSNGTDYFINSTSSSIPYGGVIFGDGDTEPTIDDYSLSGNMITDFTCTTATSVSRSDNKVVAAFTYNIRNTSSSPLTIKEFAATIPDSSASKRILLSRSLLDSPLVIPANGVGVIAHTIEAS